MDMKMMLMLCCFILFILDIKCSTPANVCQNTSRVCSSPATPCTCKNYYEIATICFYVDISSNTFAVEISSQETANFLIRVFPESNTNRILRIETASASCRLFNMPEGNYKIKVESRTLRNQVKCFCGGDMEDWCVYCDTQVTVVDYSANGSASDNETQRDTAEKDLLTVTGSEYVILIVVTCVCFVLVLLIIVLVKCCKGRFRGGITKASHLTSSSTAEVLPHPESLLTENTVILPAIATESDAQQNALDSGFESTSMCQCSILHNTYNGDDVNSAYDEKWGAFSIPKPVTYELEHNVESAISKCNGCNSKNNVHCIVPEQQLQHLAPSEVYFSPPEDQSLAVSEEIHRINSAYMKCIAAERNQRLPLMERSDETIGECQVCRKTFRSKALCPDQGYPSSAFDIISLGGKSV
ncbi:uncharacterized protein LOC132558441 isoform X2 [Ylistrum balloti]|uniref:uncharacterized protein LOC132558441 isoform X2 n=1 Tax=Ylistrum balloti TaxID=509963 RepID=UPI00290594CA|nr:uncharacterized protein LOC132558441 isoform X2 [Ylistrum balloti]